MPLSLDYPVSASGISMEQDRLAGMLAYIKAMPYAMMMESPNRLVLGWNTPFELLFSYNADRTIPDSSRRLHADIESQFNDGAQFLRHTDFIIQDARPVTSEILHLVDGRTLERNYIPLKDADKLYAQVWSYRDISARVVQTELLAETKARFELVTLATSDAVWEQDLVSGRSWNSHSFFRLFGYSPINFPKGVDGWKSRVHPEDLESVSDSLTHFLQSREESWTLEYRYRRADGSYAFILDRATVIRNDQGQPLKLIGAMSDVSERNHAQQELIRLNNGLTSLIENTEDCIWSIGREKELISWNSAFSDLLFKACGVRASFGLHLNKLKALKREYAHGVWNHGFDQALNGIRYIDVFEGGSDSSRHYAEVSFNPIRHGKDVVGATVFLRDITRRKQAEMELVAAKEEAERLNKMKSHFLANMSHEIRTPMTAILGYTSVLAEEIEVPELRKYVQVIEVSGKRLLSTVNSILDLAQVEAGRLDVFLKEIDVIKLTRSVVELLRISASNKDLFIDVESDAQELSVVTDASMLERILVNVVGNAIKFTNYGGVSIHLRRSAEDSETVVIDVCDSGIGMDKSFLSRAFIEFEQESTGFSRAYEGSGLGLSISKHLADLIGAKLLLESEKGRGTTVKINLPLGR